MNMARLVQKKAFRLVLLPVMLFSLNIDAFAKEPAKNLFGAHRLPSKTAAQAHGFYAKGCLGGGVAMPIDGPTWQAMRLSRNRRWGHPAMISLVQRLSQEAMQYDGWPGLLVGDISQPRGGPMLSGHASHQVGLDADIWLRPMPAQRFTALERESVSAISMLKKDSFEVDDRIWTPSHAKLIMRAASYPEVQRIFVHPGIKKKLCTSWNGDRANLGKVRPMWGHHYHFHIRLRCPQGSVGCKPQAPIGNEDGCGAQLSFWYKQLEKSIAPKPKPKPNAKPRKPRKPVFKTLDDLPKACTNILYAKEPANEAEVTLGQMVTPDIVFWPPPRLWLGSLKNIPVPDLEHRNKISSNAYIERPETGQAILPQSQSSSLTIEQAIADARNILLSGEQVFERKQAQTYEPKNTLNLPPVWLQLKNIKRIPIPASTSAQP